MPRIANPPRANRVPTVSSQKQSPFKIPLNDDRTEKAVRLQSRQALHDLHMNQIKAAASPIRKANIHITPASNSPQTPSSQHSIGKENIAENGLFASLSDTAMTPLKRVPILANFEEWMKMATDNKINAANSWNFALIDYFHDMSLLKEGDGVNFQKASCTLDGCVKIYTSRVDSVATETGKLLSGLATSGNKKQKSGEAEEEHDDDEEESEDGFKKRTKKRAQRSSESTLVTSFASLQLKKFELDFSVDPLFKKTSADFDEGGAKGLLLNHLAINLKGRVVFDSSDDAELPLHEPEDSRQEQDSLAKDSGSATPPADRDDLPEQQDMEINLSALGFKFFPDLSRLDHQDICPSLKEFEMGAPTGSPDIPFLKHPEHLDLETTRRGGPGDMSGIFLDDDNDADFDDDDKNGLISGFDMPADTEFGNGGESWAKQPAPRGQDLMTGTGFDMTAVEIGNGTVQMEFRELDFAGSPYANTWERGNGNGNHEDVLNYFDDALRKNWAGPEHWKIRKIKNRTSISTAMPVKRKEKEPFEIDFKSSLDPALAELIHLPASSSSVISLPKAQWKSKTRNLLPDDKHFNSRHLLRLFLKPKSYVGMRKTELTHTGVLRQQIHVNGPDAKMDEAFWAAQRLPASIEVDDEMIAQGAYDANFFEDDGLAFLGRIPNEDDDDFVDAREAISPCDAAGSTGQGTEDILASAEEARGGAFGSQLVTQNRKFRKDYVQYARVAKRVDVRRLKEEMWKSIGSVESTQSSSRFIAPTMLDTVFQPLKFTSIMNNLQGVYPKQAMADISTSYCFICLLHLANEKGLILGNEDGLEELNIRQDQTAEITEGAG